jgi:chromosome segregation ATPase
MNKFNELLDELESARADEVDAWRACADESWISHCKRLKDEARKGVIEHVAALEADFEQTASDLLDQLTRVRDRYNTRIAVLYKTCEEYAFDIDAMEDELERDQRRFDYIEPLLDELHESRQELRIKLEETDRTLAHVNSEVDTLVDENRELRARVEYLQDELAGL